MKAYFKFLSIVRAALRLGSGIAHIQCVARCEIAASGDWLTAPQTHKLGDSPHVSPTHAVPPLSRGKMKLLGGQNV